MLYQFAAYALDTEKRELTDDGRLVALEPQVFDLLVFLIEQRDRVVSKDDLITAVWRGRIVSEFDLDQPHQCRAQGDRRQRRNANLDPHRRAQRLSLRWYAGSEKQC